MMEPTIIDDRFRRGGKRAARAICLLSALATPTFSLADLQSQMAAIMVGLILLVAGIGAVALFLPEQEPRFDADFFQSFFNPLCVMASSTYAGRSCSLRCFPTHCGNTSTSGLPLIADKPMNRAVRLAASCGE
jgi:hypothetical protein